MNDGMRNVIDSFIESVGNFGASLGVSKVVTQIYALLYMSSEPLSLDEICDFLKISKGNVCMNIRYLEEWNAVKKIWQKGSRKDFYEVNPDIEKIIYNRLKEGLDRRLSEFMDNIKKIEKILETTEDNSKNRRIIKTYRERFKKIKKMSNIINKFLLLGKTFI